jgi:hypothetical protein
MHPQLDYEMEDILAVFDNPDAAREAVRRAREIVGDPHRVMAVPLPRGRYQVADLSVQEIVHGAMRTARKSVPLGTLAGLGMAALALPGAGAVAMAGMALAGAVGGLVVGGMTGAIARSRWDPNPADVLTVPPDSQAMLVIVRASPAPARKETSRVLSVLARAGAVAFLDPAAYYANHPHPEPEVASLTS